MAKDKVCKKCKMFVEGSVCPVCKSNQFTTIYQGRLTILEQGFGSLWLEYQERWECVCVEVEMGRELEAHH